MALDADLFSDCVKFIEQNNIRKLSDIHNIEVDVVYDFVRVLLGNFDTLSDNEENDYGPPPQK